MHGLADIIVASESEREIAHATAHMGTGQVLADPGAGADEVGSIAVVLLNAGGDGQHIGVDDDVAGAETGLLAQQRISPPCYLDTALVGGGLPFLVEAHDDDGSPIAPDGGSMVEEALLAFFQ